VCWAQFAEFVDDGGYDDRRWWSPAGWDQVEAGARRAPRYVEQVSGGVLARRQGRLQRLPGAQSVLHATAWEAEAWCRWAGRRLPTEAEWELAASTASARGFAWGDGLEWVAGSARHYPGAGAGPAALDALPVPADGAPAWRVLRGASAWASPRLHHPRARRYAGPAHDELFVGFRSCAL
jgi:formylglycine-generating enzyme required for sulfatase activity